MTDASIRAVAQRAGVSIATVSRVLSPSGHPVSPAVRDRVLAAARDLNYAPSALARALRTLSTRLVGILVGDNADPYFAEIIRGVEEVANRVGYLTIVANTERRPDRELRYVRMLRAYRAEGIIFAGGGRLGQAADRDLAAEVAALDALGCAVVATTQHRLAVPHVCVDGDAAAALAARHLVDLGHTRIGVVAGPPALAVSHIRLAGFRRALADAGLALDPALVVPGDFTRAGGEAAADRLLDLPADRRPTAIFAADDLMAIGVLTAARRRGLRVPADLSVVGFDDIPLADSVDPPLTTVHLPLRELGEAAMATVLAKLSGEAVAPARLLPAHLVVRASTAPPPDGTS